MRPIFRIALCLFAVCLMSAAVLAADGETLYSEEYCFCESDFQSTDELSGIFVTQIPDPKLAVVRLGGRTICVGDVLTAELLDALRLTPTTAETSDAVLCYRPISGASLGAEQQLTIRIQSGKNQHPTANTAELETYKNIPNDGVLTGSDPEDESLTFLLAQAPKRGSVQLEADGTFVYTPHKNKVGEDSFSFTVTDEAGNVSEPAIVKIRILKPSDSMTFSDMEGSSDCFEAMWLCEQGLSSARLVAGQPCFCPNETISRSDFLITAMALSQIEPEDSLVSGFCDVNEMPTWKQAYLATAMRCGLVRGEVTDVGLCFRPDDPITSDEAAVILQSILRLPVSAASTTEDVPAWASGAVSALLENGISYSFGGEALTRADAATLFYALYHTAA